MTRRYTPVEVSWPDTPEFVEAADFLAMTTHERFVELLWDGYGLLRRRLQPVREGMEDVERSVTQILFMCIADVMIGPTTFYCVHGFHEQETRMPAPAQPPTYDLAFVFRANPRMSWPIEAKVLWTDTRIAPYVHDVVDQYLTCRYGPFSNSGAMLGYLVTGDAGSVLDNVASALGSKMLSREPRGMGCRGHTLHSRTVPEGKLYPIDFACHHLVMPVGG